jgi:hypothetical protein
MLGSTAVVRLAKRPIHFAVMTIGASLFLIAVGAILRYAVTASVAGIDLDVAGLILMVVGAVGLAISLFFRSYGQSPGVPPPPPP